MASMLASCGLRQRLRILSSVVGWREPSSLDRLKIVVHVGAGRPGSLVLKENLSLTESQEGLAVIPCRCHTPGHGRERGQNTDFEPHCRCRRSLRLPLA